MRPTMETIEDLVEELTQDQKQLLIDTIFYGAWGYTLAEFIYDDGLPYQYPAMGFLTSEAAQAGNFSEKEIQRLFKSICKKLCPQNNRGEFFSYKFDWWGDSTSDIIFIYRDFAQAFEEWAWAKR